MMKLTDKEIRDAWGDRRSPSCGIVDCDRALAEAQLRKIYHKINSMVADGFYLAEILEAIAKELEE